MKMEFTLDEANKINALYERVLSVQNLSSDRNKFWSTITIGTIKSTFELIITQTHFRKLGINKPLDNSFIQIEFPKEASGISRNKTMLTKFGGMLEYVQLHNGYIAVTAHTPYIENATDEKRYRLGTYDPEKIDKALVLKHFEEFIGYVNSWEESKD